MAVARDQDFFAVLDPVMSFENCVLARWIL
jgi:hypothetical protein